LSIPSNHVLFDQIIRAFKLNDSILSRTSHEKKYSDFINCALLSKHTEVCFIDDIDFSKMKNEKVYYIRPRSYLHRLSINEIIKRFLKKK